ncbi:MAG: GNAT family N-acetyltransferase [Bacteroidota bacterium]
MPITDKLSIVSCQKTDIEVIVKGINAYNLEHVPAMADVWAPIELAMKNEGGEVIAGVLSGIGYWNGLEIKVLWVEEEYRRKGIGSRLLQHLEDIAKGRGATIAMLDTFDFQAEAFYLKNDYEKVGEIKNFPTGHRRIYFSKRLV